MTELKSCLAGLGNYEVLVPEMGQGIYDMLLVPRLGQGVYDVLVEGLVRGIYNILVLVLSQGIQDMLISGQPKTRTSFWLSGFPPENVMSHSPQCTASNWLSSEPR